jgi:CheY-like chemotaxis protein
VGAGGAGRGEQGLMVGLVLLVDDSDSFRSLASRILREWGHEVIEAGTVAEARAQVIERRPETVIADIGLPDGDGFDLTRQILRLPWPTRVVLISTDSDMGNSRAADRAGAQGFFPKDKLLSADFKRVLNEQ